MPVIRMLVDMQGSRFDGRSWPGYYGEIEVDEWEAEQLIRGGNAEYPEKPKLDRGYDVLKVRDTTDVDSQLKLADGSDQDVTEDEDDDFESDAFDGDDWDDDDDFDRDDEDDFEREGSSIVFAETGTDVVKTDTDVVPTDQDQPVTDQTDNFSPPPGPYAGEVDRPSQTDNKAAWIDWAVYNGIDRNVAEEMTKAQLVARFKGR